MRTILIMVDGLRPDAIADHPAAKRVMAMGATCLQAHTVMPSVTLPCHMSLFHSVEPTRHGITTNTYIPMARPINGICETLHAAGKSSAFFYTWDEIRDLARPGIMRTAYLCRGADVGYAKANHLVTNAAIDFLVSIPTDFIFLYLGFTDMNGHSYGWMSPEYMRAVDNSFSCIEQVLDFLPEDYSVIITADHGGHGRNHGIDIPEDMTIPVIAIGKDFAPGSTLENVSILDIAPTVTALLGVKPDPEWEGKPIF